MSAVAVDSLPEGKKNALEALRSLARASGGALMVDRDYRKLGGYLIVRVYLSSASLLSSDKGITLEAWEPIDILIPSDFPYGPPIAWAARDDFPELPHQARGSGFCVRVEDNNWDFAAGIPGFLRAVIDTYQRIALGALQGHLQPWRPMVDYRGKGCAVIRADLPATGHDGPGTPFRWGVGIQVNEDRIDIVEWLDVDEGAAVDLTNVLSKENLRVKAENPAAFLVPAVVMAKPVALEYADLWIQLVYRLEEQGIGWTQLRGHLARLATIEKPQTGGQEPAAVLFRVAADTEPTAAGQDARFAVARLPQRDVSLLARVHAAEGAVASLAESIFNRTPVPWVQVYDGRPESALRRAAGRPAEKVKGARILLLGCGGLGAPIAEHCVRAGAARVHIVDSGTVSPGVLSRQPYEDADIGQHKAPALAARLGRIRPDVKVTPSVAEITDSGLFDEATLSDYDLIIDATANRSVAARIERVRRDHPNSWPALATVAISQHATHGVAAVTPKGAVGAGIDLLRRLGLGTCMSTALGDVYSAFFPSEARKLNFRPDASCSDTTFIGSTTDMGALAAQLLDGALARLNLPPSATGSGQPHRSLSIVRLSSDDELKAARVVLDLPPDRVEIDHKRAYEVRVDESAVETIREHVRASVNGRTRGAGRTAGLLLGQFDSTCRIAWVSQATGLPPDSTADPLDISVDSDKVRDFLETRRRRSGGMLTLVGFWRTHLGDSPAPSEADRAAMRKMAARRERHSAPALLLVLGVPGDGSDGEPASPWPLKIHAETFTTENDAPGSGQ